MAGSRSSVGVAAALLAFCALLTASSAQPQQPFCPQCLSVRIGPPKIIRGPSGQESDAPFVVLKRADGSFRGFTSNHRTYAIDGSSPLDMGGQKRVVLQPGRKGTLSDCGNWLTGTLPVEGKWLGLIHGESACDYDKNQTHKAMAIATSSDEGLNWSILGAAITGADKPAAAKQTGEGDCTLAEGGDNFLYIYCLRPSDWKITAARAARTNPGPGQWMKWDGADWRMPALDRVAAPLAGFPGHSAARIGRHVMGLLAVNKSLKLSLSSDKVNFTQLAAPLVAYETDEWRRPAPDALYSYPSLIDEHGTNSIGTRGILSYAYVPPNEDFTQRYLVMHNIALTFEDAPQDVPVHTALARYKAADGRLWTTVAPPIEKGPGTFAHESTLGDLMTAAPKAPSEKLEECVRESADVPGYLLTSGGCDRGYRRQRTAGFVFRDAQPGSVALYRCAAPRGRFHFASTQDNCEGMGMNEKRLGFVLKP